MYQAIFFDNDGILVDTEPLYFEASRRVLAELSCELTRDWYMREQLRKGKSTFTLAEENGYSDEEISQYKEKRSEVYAELLRQGVPLIDGVRETLSMLSTSYKMGVVTSSMREHFDIIMEQTNLSSFFDFTITADDVSKTKPDPQPYLQALHTVELQPQDCLVVEDSERGIEAAHSANLSCIAIPTALTSSHNFQKAEIVLKSIRDLPTFLHL